MLLYSLSFPKASSIKLIWQTFINNFVILDQFKKKLRLFSSLVCIYKQKQNKLFIPSDDMLINESYTLIGLEFKTTLNEFKIPSIVRNALWGFCTNSGGTANK